MATGLLALGLSGLLAACGGGEGGTTAAGSSTTGSVEPTPATEVPTTVAELPGSTSAPGPGQPGAPPRTTARPAVTAATPGRSDVAPDVSTLPSGEIRLRSVAVLAVDASARTFTLVGKPSGYNVVVTTGVTQFKLAEGEPASFANVEPEVLVSVTGTASAADRLTARLVTILG